MLLNNLQALRHNIQELFAKMGGNKVSQIADSDRKPWTIVRRFDQILCALITPYRKVLRS